MYRLVLVVFFVLIFAGITTAHADELFILHDMLISGDYQGVFIRDDSKLYQVILLASNSDIIDTDDSNIFEMILIRGVRYVCCLIVQFCRNYTIRLALSTGHCRNHLFFQEWMMII